MAKKTEKAKKTTREKRAKRGKRGKRTTRGKTKERAKKELTKIFRNVLATIKLNNKINKITRMNQMNQINQMTRMNKIRKDKQDIIRKLYLKNFKNLNDYYQKFPSQYNNLMKCKTKKKIINKGNTRGYVIEQVCRN